MRIQYSEGINFDWLNGFGNIRLWPAKTFVWRGVTRDLRIEMRTTCTIAKLIKKEGTMASVFEFNI